MIILWFRLYLYGKLIEFSFTYDKLNKVENKLHIQEANYIKLEEKLKTFLKQISVVWQFFVKE